MTTARYGATTTARATHAAPAWPRRKPPVVKTPGPPEWLLQSWMVDEFNKLEEEGYALSVVADMNAGKRSRWAQQQAKAMGMKAGEPDLRLYGSGARTLFIEVKKPKGRKSKAQDDRIDRLSELGFNVLIAAPEDEAQARKMARNIALKFCDPAGGLL